MAAGDGLISMTPTSVSAGSGTATINADGGVEISGASDITLSGVFSADFDNYLVVGSVTYPSGDAALRIQLTAAGLPDTGGNYTWEYMQSLITPGQPTVTAGRISNYTFSSVATLATGFTGGFQLHMYGPYLSQPTAFRSTSAGGQRYNAQYADLTYWATTHSLSSQYDGVKLFVTSSNFTGTVHVFGYEE